MEFIYIGEIINTHALKGELKIRSNFKYIDRVTKKGFKWYINNHKEEVTINSSRKYRGYPLVTFVDHLDINDVLGFKGEKAFINRADLVLDKNEHLNEDLIGLECFVADKYVGKVNTIINNNASDIFVIRDNERELMIPYVDEFVNEIDVENKKIIFNDMKGLVE